MTTLSRRAFLRHTTRIGALVPISLTLGACTSGPNCDDVSALSTPDRLRRESVEYTSESAQGDEESCANCKFFTTGAAGQCGSCSLVPGPIAAAGRCTLWAAS